MADTPAAPAAPNPAAKGTSISSLASTFDSRVALARQGLGKPAESAPAGKPKAAPVVVDNIDDPPAEAEAQTEETETPAEAEEVAEEAEATEETEGAAGTPEEQLEAVGKAFDAGDFDEVCKALGKDPAKVNLPTKKRFRALARELVKVTTVSKRFEASKKAAHAELAAESNRISAVGRGLAVKFKPFEETAKAWEDQDALAVGKGLEKQFGTDLASLTQFLASAKSGKTPEEKSLDEKRAELERKEKELEQKAKKGDDEKAAAAKRDAAIARTGEQLKGHPFVTIDGEPDPEALAEVFEAYEKTWDGKRFAKTPKQCADELQAALKAKAAKRGLVAFAAPGKGPKPAAKPTPRPRLAEPPRSAPPKNLGTPEYMEETRESRMAETRKRMEMSRRGVR